MKENENKSTATPAEEKNIGIEWGVASVLSNDRIMKLEVTVDQDNLLSQLAELQDRAFMVHALAGQLSKCFKMTEEKEVKTTDM